MEVTVDVTQTEGNRSLVHHSHQYINNKCSLTTGAYSYARMVAWRRLVKAGLHLKLDYHAAFRFDDLFVFVSINIDLSKWDWLQHISVGKSYESVNILTQYCARSPVDR